MKKIGVTGSIGAGKSFVGSLLRQRGFLVLDADKAVHELYRDNQDLRKKLAAKFGEKCLTETGVDRKYLADLIFNNEGERQELESTVYPYLTDYVSRFLSSSLDGEKIRFVEAALFTRTPEILDMLDEIWIVNAPEDVRHRRLVARGLVSADAHRRIVNQRGICDAKLFPANKVRLLENSEDSPSLERQLEAALWDFR